MTEKSLDILIRMAGESRLLDPPAEPRRIVHPVASVWWRFGLGISAVAACMAAWISLEPPQANPLSPTKLHMPIAGVPYVPTSSAPGACIVGDSNCDGRVDLTDVMAFNLALHQPDEYVTKYPGCDPVCSADMNGDCIVDDSDMNELMTCVGG